MGNSLKSKVEPLYGDKLVYSYKNHPGRNPDDIYYLRSDDVCATAYWYQYPLIAERETLPDKADRTENLYKIKKKHNSDPGDDL